jgi:hypothetical protein
MKSVPETAKIHDNVFQTLGQLAVNCGSESLDIFISAELGKILPLFRYSHKTWRKNSPDRFAFDSFVRNTGEIKTNNWKDVLEIIANCVESSKDIEMKMDMIALVQYLVTNPEIKEQVSQYSEFIIRCILMKAVQWRPFQAKF